MTGAVDELAAGATCAGATTVGAGGGVSFLVPISAKRRSRSATEPTLSAAGGRAAKEGTSVFSSSSEAGLDIIMVAGKVSFCDIVWQLVLNHAERDGFYDVLSVLSSRQEEVERDARSAMYCTVRHSTESTGLADPEQKSSRTRAIGT